MKNYFIEKIKSIKNWLAKEKWFLLILAFATISLFVSMFTEFALIATFVTMIVCGILFTFEKSICLFLFCYSFEAIFYINYNQAKTFIFTLFYSILFAICLIKYFILILKKQRKFNLKILIPLLLFLVYILIPINKIKFDDISKYVIAFGFIYLLLEQKDDVSINNLIIAICLSLILSFVFSLFVRYSNRMIDIMGGYFNYGIRKRQGMFTNPNWLAVYSCLVIAWLIYKLIFKDFIYLIPLLFLIPYTYGTLSRDYILCLIITVMFLSIMLCFNRKRINFIRYATSLVLILCVAFSQFNITRIYGRRLGSIYSEACHLFGIERKVENKPSTETTPKPTPSPDPEQPPKDNQSQETTKPPATGNIEEMWKDGTPIDAGRVEIWKRYMKDFTSSPKKILFGAGVSAEVLGISPHNTFINIVWQFGVIGVILLFLVFGILAKELIKNKRILSILMIGLICLISLFESNVFNYVALMMICILVMSSKRKKEEKEMEKHYEENISDNTSL